jgi:uncharacterized protein YjbI with pentapeptide repeats
VVTTGDARLTDLRTPVDGSVSTAKIVDKAITEPKLSASNVPTSGQLLSYNGTDFTWVAQPTGTATDPTMGGSLTGTASNAQIVPNAITVTELNTNAVVTVKIADANVTTSKIADNAITEPKLAASNVPALGQVLSYDGANLTWATQAAGNPTLGGDLSGTASNAQIAAGVVGATELGSNAVTTVKITDANVTTIKIADDAITEPKLAVSNVPTTGQVLSYNGTALAWSTTATGDPTLGGDLSGTTSNAQIAAGVVGATELATNSVTTIKITDANITSAKIADANVTTAKIADANVTTAKVANDAITEPKLAVSNVPTTGQVLSYNGTTLTWITPAAGTGSTWTAVVRSATYTAVSGNFVICDTTTSGFTVTLPAADNGAYVSVKKLTNNANAILVAPPSGNIDAGSSTSTTIAVNSYGQVVDFIADGTTWHQVG